MFMEDRIIFRTAREKLMANQRRDKIRNPRLYAISSRILSAICAIYSLFVGLVLPVRKEYPNKSSNVSAFPLTQETSIAFLMARSTFCSVVLNSLAISGYKSLVTLPTTSISFPAIKIAVRK